MPCDEAAEADGGGGGGGVVLEDEANTVIVWSSGVVVVIVLVAVVTGDAVMVRGCGDGVVMRVPTVLRLAIPASPGGVSVP